MSNIPYTVRAIDLTGERYVQKIKAKCASDAAHLFMRRIDLLPSDFLRYDVYRAGNMPIISGHHKRERQHAERLGIKAAPVPSSGL